ncbi:MULTISPECIES: hypothetical protein [unclassified Luteococcus]|uniref:hypothetical protein n=1 Tax=unclassified Luteococcus TaxID=2639923 RepID=UPI00313AF7E7
MKPLTAKELAEFQPIPNHPNYLIHPDGRVATLMSRPPHILSEQKGSIPAFRRVRFGGRDWRVTDLVALLGDLTALAERIEHEYYEDIPW